MQHAAWEPAGTPQAQLLVDERPSLGSSVVWTLVWSCYFQNHEWVGSRLRRAASLLGNESWQHPSVRVYSAQHREASVAMEVSPRENKQKQLQTQKQREMLDPFSSGTSVGSTVHRRGVCTVPRDGPFPRLGTRSRTEDSNRAGRSEIKGQVSLSAPSPHPLPG